MALYEISEDSIRKIEQTTFQQSGLYERGDLQRLLKRQIEVILPDTLIIAEEFGEWEDSRRRIDLLGIDKEANLIVIELKRTEDGGHMELQAIRYAAMVSTMTFEKAVELFAGFKALNSLEGDAKDELLEFLNWGDDSDGDFGRDVRIVLVSSNFSKELTTAVIWLNQHDLDLRCIRLVPHVDGTRTLIDVQQIIPLPEAAEYQVRIKEKEHRERTGRVSRGPLRRFWETLLELGEGKCQLHPRMTAADRKYIGASTGIRGLTFYYVAGLHDSRVELYIDRSNAAENEKIFNELKEHQTLIEQRFGGQLSWHGLFGKRACRLAFEMKNGGYRDDESSWPEIQEEMIDSMERFANALTPVFPTLSVVKKH